MASSDKQEKKEEKRDEEKGGFLDKVKDFIHDVGEKIEETVGFGKPTADVTAIHIDSIDLKRADLVVDILVANPNPIPIPLVDINYLIESTGRKLISGKIPDAGTIHAHGSETIKVPLTLIYDDIKSTYNDIEPGSVIPYKVRVELIVDLPVFGNITLPMEKNGEIPVPYKPEIDLQKIKFDNFSFEETSATLFLKVENMNDFDLGLNSLEYEMCLGEVSIGGARLSKSAVIGKKGNGVVELPISFRPKEFGSALWDMIRGKGTGYSMKGSLDVNTPFGPMKLPFHREGGSTKLKKAGDNDSGNEGMGAGEGRREEREIIYGMREKGEGRREGERCRRPESCEGGASVAREERLGHGGWRREEREIIYDTREKGEGRESGADGRGAAKGGGGRGRRKDRAWFPEKEA